MNGATTIQERLKDLRLNKGLKPEELAEQTGISKSALGSYEKDDYKEINHGNLIFSHMVLDDLSLIIRDIREAHKKDSASAPQTTVADELKENGNTYQPEEKTVKKNRCCMVCWLPCSSGLYCGYLVENQNDTGSCLSKMKWNNHIK